MTRIITALSEISANYDALFVDLWGCVHNGITAFDEAVRHSGITVQTAALWCW